MNLFPSNNQTLIASTTTVATGTPLPCRGFSIALIDLAISSTAQVNFEGSGDSGVTYRQVIGSPLTGAASSVSATASGLWRFNVAGLDYWRPSVATVSIGTVEVLGVALAGGVDNVPTEAGGSAVTQGGPFDVRLIASTPTIGTVNIGQADVRLIVSTATAATVTTVNQKSATPPAINTVSLGTFASPTFAANATRKSFWVQNVGTSVVYLGLGATPSATAYHFALASGTLAHSGNGGIYFDSEWVGTVTAIASAATGTYTYGETV